MRTQRILPATLLLALGIAAGLGTTYAWQTRPTPPAASAPADILGGWLRLPPSQLRALRDIDPGFSAERDELETTLATERETLAALFEQPDADDQAILDQVERVIAAHAALERRVARYLLAVRPHLTDPQRARLFEHAASGVREAGRRWRGGRDAELENNRRVGGPPSDRGRGFGRGRGGPNRNVTPADPDPQPASQPKGDVP